MRRVQEIAICFVQYKGDVMIIREFRERRDEVCRVNGSGLYTNECHGQTRLCNHVGHTGLFGVMRTIAFVLGVRSLLHSSTDG